MNYYLKLALIIGAVIVIVAFLILAIVLISKKKNNKQDQTFPNLLEALGGKENITQVSQKGSRVSAIVIDKKIVNKDKLKAEGVETIVVSNMKVTMLIDNKISILVYDYLKNQIEI